MATEKLWVPDEASPDATTLYLGFDRYGYPGDTVMSDWWTYSPFFFVAFWLAPTAGHPDTGWMTKRSYLKGVGWGFLPIYFGRQDGGSGLTYAQGQADAHQAATYAINAGFQFPAYLFLDAEGGPPLSAAYLNYLNGWVTEINTNSVFNAGVYCSHSTATSIKSKVGTQTCKFWVWNLTCPTPSPGCVATARNPNTCGYANAEIWQYAQNPRKSGVCTTGYQADGDCEVTYHGHTLTLDLDSALSGNPGSG